MKLGSALAIPKTNKGEKLWKQSTGTAAQGKREPGTAQEGQLGFLLFLHGSDRNATDDVSREDRVNNNNRYDGKSKAQIDGAVFSTIYIASKGLHQHGQCVFILG